MQGNSNLGGLKYLGYLSDWICICKKEKAKWNSKIVSLLKSRIFSLFHLFSLSLKLIPKKLSSKK